LSYISSRRRVFFVLHRPAGGGAERVMLDVFGALDRRRFAPELVFLKTDRGPYQEMWAEDMPVHNLQGQNSSTIVPRLAQLIRGRSPDVILSTLFKNNLVTIIAAKLSGQDVGVVLRQANNPTLALNQARNSVVAYAKKRIYALAYPHADHFVAISQGIKDDMVNSFRIPGDRISVIHNPVDIDRITRMARCGVMHPWLQAGSSTPVLVAAGRLVEQKGLDVLLHAFAIAAQSTPARLIVLGRGVLRDQLLSLSGQLGVSDHVDFAGFQANPYSFMRNSQLFVLSSRWEGLGLVILEAMATGTPVVATDCPFGPGELVSDGETGLLVPVEDPEALARAITYALSNPDHAAAMSARARQFVQGFDLVHVTKQYATVLEAAGR